MRYFVLLLLALFTGAPSTVAHDDGCRVVVRRTISSHPDINQTVPNGNGWISLWGRADGLLAVGRIEAYGQYRSQRTNGGTHSLTSARDYRFVCRHEAGKVTCTFDGFGTTFGAGSWRNMLGSVVMVTHQAASASCADEPLELKPEALEMGNEPSSQTSIDLQIDIPLIQGASIRIRSSGLESDDPNVDSTSGSDDDMGGGSAEMGRCSFSTRSFVSVGGSVSGTGGVLWERGHLFLDVRYQICWAKTTMSCSTHAKERTVLVLDMWGEDLLAHLQRQANRGTPVPGPDGPLNYANGVGRGSTWPTVP